jgi:hypothetical protein
MGESFASGNISGASSTRSTLNEFARQKTSFNLSEHLPGTNWEDFYPLTSEVL